MDQLPPFRGPQNRSGYHYLKGFFFRTEWYKVYDFIEFLAQDKDTFIDQTARAAINQILQAENAAYRLVGDKITEITDKNEIKAIEVALSHPEDAVREHLRTALTRLSDRKEPDYRNSIKESISAVEAVCRLLSGNKSATLGDALKLIKDLHPAMSKGFSALYGYTSDQSGIRHSLLDEATVTYEDAKFMLITCAAFVSFLAAKGAQLNPTSANIRS